MKRSLTAAAIALATTSNASAYTTQDLLNNFINIALNDLDAAAETEGTLYVGGNITGITSPAGVTTIINVSGTNPTIGINANNNINKNDVLFNFYEARSLTVNSTFNYSILAPKADVTLNDGGVFGTVVSNNLDQNAERGYSLSFRRS